MFNLNIYKVWLFKIRLHKEINDDFWMGKINLRGEKNGRQKEEQLDMNWQP